MRHATIHDKRSKENNNSTKFNKLKKKNQNRGQFRNPTSRGIQKRPAKFHITVNNGPKAENTADEAPEDIDRKQKRSNRFDLNKNTN